ncbi:DNA polymerase V [Vibrio parahaemolyticus]|uniref:LexA family protein n=1 Tax=Vibrio parahaemolyticus TaxID=670 RepID=UPI0006A5BCBF|nr:DNA polymerase V [Vibrio parahaemolyticus]
MNIIPFKASAGITGFESPANDYHTSSLSLDNLLIHNPNSTWIGCANGDSMEGVGIYNNDLLIVDRSKVATHHSVIVATLNGEFVCKIWDEKRHLLLSANDKYQAAPVTEYDSFSFEGVVIHSIRNHSQSTLELFK